MDGRVLLSESCHTLCIDPAPLLLFKVAVTAPATVACDIENSSKRHPLLQELYSFESEQLACVHIS